MKVLVLGGTGEADALCLALEKEGIAFLHSRAGALANPKPLSYPHRDAGFGGVDGLATFLAAEGFSHVILATHPFARQIAIHARRAAEIVGLPLRELHRPSWTPPPGSDWRRFDDMDDLVDALPTAARVFLTIGRKHLAAFLRRADLWFLVRTIEPSDVMLPGIRILARPPFSLDDEIATMRTHRIECLVTRNSGGEATRAKIDAAALLGLPVFLLQRGPGRAPATSSETASVLDWLKVPS